MEDEPRVANYNTTDNVFGTLIFDNYGTNRSIDIKRSANISGENEIVIEVTDHRDNKGDAKFRINKAEKLDIIIEKLTKLRKEVFG